MCADNLPIAEPIVQNVWSTERTIVVKLTDGRSISFPADRFKILAKANDELLKRPRESVAHTSK